MDVRTERAPAVASEGDGNPPGVLPRSDAAARVGTTLVSFIVGLSVILSLDWTSMTFRPDAWTTILSGIAVGAIVYIAIRYASRGNPYRPGGVRLCPTCGRAIPPDSQLCPYCGQRLS